MHSTRHRWQTATDSFWFFPALLLVTSVVLAELLVALDRTFLGSGIAGLPFVSAINPSRYPAAPSIRRRDKARLAG